MKTGWAAEQVKTRHLRYARTASGAGVTWHPLRKDDQPAVTGLVREHILGCENFTFDRDSGGMIAINPANDIIGAAVVAAMQIEVQSQDVVMLLLRHLVVSPAWRGKGVGVVTLGLLNQVLPSPASLTLGNCAAQDARFYQRAGFTVLNPGEELPMRVSADRGFRIQLSNKNYPCWMYRDW